MIEHFIEFSDKYNVCSGIGKYEEEEKILLTGVSSEFFWFNTNFIKTSSQSSKMR